MKMIPVESSNIASIGWENMELYITFNFGATYVYYDVPEEVFEEMLDAPSKGKYFHANIKGKYDYDKA